MELLPFVAFARVSVGAPLLSRRSFAKPDADARAADLT
jgi:hypothetical protein